MMRRTSSIRLDPNSGRPWLQWQSHAFSVDLTSPLSLSPFQASQTNSRRLQISVGTQLHTA
ncbi:hypothetical protein FOIG_16053 [Fusarium odoratissimum NRRL 54006]|uniref:Uncharacterized protein n=1 Tax=Fusarium odoratissimum (strain NRRL 54006) TaxID=1089451 RepID=X0K0Z7_FUSO5|nr:uncharacterized protein FOIG_16053 [Fusarium odoratissimum NRRL 54006]EXL90759.1 hypothetical protein FOIG_16053 [Fusarium odoratissimum NRRL 54006]